MAIDEAIDCGTIAKAIAKVIRRMAISESADRWRRGTDR